MQSDPAPALPALPIPTKLAVLISGGGRTLLNLARFIRENTLDAEIVAVIGSRPGLAGLERARDLNLPCDVIDYRAFPDTPAFSAAVFDGIRERAADLVCLAGFLRLVIIPDDYAGRVINIHPALLPDFGGKGMFGDRVHRAVLDSGSRESGCTVHLADNEYDHGPILLQKRVPVQPDDTVDTLAARVFEAECAAYPEAIRMLQHRPTRT